MKIILFFLAFFLIIQLDAQKLSSYIEKIPNSDIRFEMISVPEGNYHGNKVESFWIGKTEVTYDEYQLFFEEERDSEPKPPAEGPDAITRPSPPYIDFTLGMGKVGGYPANSMQQYAALMYCKWLYAKTKIFYRLPTEAEWEYALFIGQKNNPKQDFSKIAWFSENSDNKYSKVAQKMPNDLGIYDMLGNVSEWVLDHYTNEKKNKNSHEAVFIEKDAPAVVKGGNFKSLKNELQIDFRIPADPIWNRRDPQIPKSKWWNADAPFVGFRIVRPKIQPDESEIRAFFSKYIDD